MPGDAPPDAFLRFCHKGDSSTWPKLYGESRDTQLPGNPFIAKSEGWFFITNFHFSLTGAAAKSGGSGSSGAAPSKGAAPAAQGSGHPAASGHSSDEGHFQGVEVTMPTQYGSIRLMELCTEFAIKKPEDVTKIDKAYIYVRRAGYKKPASSTGSDTGSGQDWFLAYYLFGVTIANFSTGLQCEDTFTLNYEKMQVEYYVTDPYTSNIVGSPIFWTMVEF